MKKLLSSALLASGLAASAAANAALPIVNQLLPQKPVTLAVIGDWPYGQVLFDNASLLIDSVNADPQVSRVLHVGDIHAGSQPCTSAGILPALSTAIPGYNQSVYGFFQRFAMPFVYMPGDNEWTDCHKSKEKSSGDPLKELASVRELFFARPGHTLGLYDADVSTQAQDYDLAHPEDAQFVENVMWVESQVLFVTLNVPGSNNDTLPWSGSFANPAAQSAEVAARDAANQRWLKAAFQQAARIGARGVVIALQADMWDPAALVSGGDGLSAYTPFVRTLANLVIGFKKPVLLINGDSHVYGSDRPLADPGSATGLIHGTPAAPNLQRITVQGSTSAPAEWLKLTINPNRRDLFSFVNVPYCRDPSTSCQ